MTSPMCPTCGKPLPADAPGGACPRCMLEAGFATGSGGGRATAEHAPTPDELATKFPGLEIGAELGRGGMGVVYRARHKALDRAVALKVLPAALAGDPAFAERFQREARALAKLQHPNIVAVHDFGQTDGLFWLVMEFVDGANIRQAMRAGQIHPKEALAIVPQICDALQYAHEHGVVHRDIKPENVLIDKTGRVKVADFGLAKLMEHGVADRTLTGAGQVMGTPHYMAPEQWEKPNDVDHRADIYSLGVVFYEMLTGELPVGRFAAPSGKCDVDSRIDEIVLRTLEREREARYQHVDDVKTDVGRATSAAARAPAAGAAAAPVASKTWRFNSHDEKARGGKLSKLAVSGALGVPAAIVLLLVIAIANPAGDATAARMLGCVVAVLLACWLVSIVAWIRIHYSGDRLRGRAWAATGTILPLLAPCLAVPIFALTTVSGAPERAERQVGQQFGGEDVPAPMPENTGVESLAAKDVLEIQRLWDLLREAHARLEFKATAPFYDSAVFGALGVVPVDLRNRTASGGGLGLPLADAKFLRGPLMAYSFLRVERGTDSRHARGMANSPMGQIRFGLVKDDDGWRFTTDPVVFEAR